VWTVRGRVADLADVVHHLQPDGLPGLVGVGQPVPAAERPHQRGVPLDDRISRPLVAVARVHHQAGDWHGSGHRGCLNSHFRDLLPLHRAADPGRF